MTPDAPNAAPPKRDKKSRKRNTAWFVGLAAISICACGGVLVLPALLLPLLAQSRYPKRQVDCLSNIRKTGAAQLLYATDFDDTLAPSKTWVEASIPFIDTTSNFQCPAVKSSSFGFAMNEFVGGEPISKVKTPTRTVMLFESNQPGMNAHGYPVTDSAKPPRHSGANNVATMDGSAKPVVQVSEKDPRRPASP